MTFIRIKRSLSEFIQKCKKVCYVTNAESNNNVLTNIRKTKHIKACKSMDDITSSVINAPEYIGAMTPIAPKVLLPFFHLTFHSLEADHVRTLGG